MTDLEILERSIKTISGLQIPVELTETVALPLSDVNGLLKLLYNALLQNAQKNKAAAEMLKEEELSKADEPEEIPPVSDEEVSEN